MLSQLYLKTGRDYDDEGASQSPSGSGAPAVIVSSSNYQALTASQATLIPIKMAQISPIFDAYLKGVARTVKPPCEPFLQDLVYALYCLIFTTDSEGVYANVGYAKDEACVDIRVWMCGGDWNDTTQKMSGFESNLQQQFRNARDNGNYWEKVRITWWLWDAGVSYYRHSFCGPPEPVHGMPLASGFQPLQQGKLLPLGWFWRDVDGDVAESRARSLSQRYEQTCQAADDRILIRIV
ncbi:hypothetical protein F4859DRAFT_130674 [Xylaria cf. heliscus]|nr:hypothetical protein F4859DRAFT_130674 [Xylaria cf. heliscus]